TASSVLYSPSLHDALPILWSWLLAARVIVGLSTNSTVEYIHAAVTPIDTSVSMVEAPCRAALTAPRWNGQPPQKVMGNDNDMATQPQSGNWKTVNIEMKNSGTFRSADHISRGFSAATPGASSIWDSSTSTSSAWGWSVVSPWSVAS